MALSTGLMQGCFSSIALAYFFLVEVKRLPWRRWRGKWITDKKLEIQKNSEEWCSLPRQFYSLVKTVFLNLILRRRTLAILSPFRKCDFRQFWLVDKSNNLRQDGQSWPVSATLRHPRSESTLLIRVFHCIKSQDIFEKTFVQRLMHVPVNRISGIPSTQ